MSTKYSLENVFFTLTEACVFLYSCSPPAHPKRSYTSYHTNPLLMNYIFCLNISVPQRALPVTAGAGPLQCALGPGVSGEFVGLEMGVGSKFRYCGEHRGGLHWGCVQLLKCLKCVCN